MKTIGKQPKRKPASRARDGAAIASRQSEQTLARIEYSPMALGDAGCVASVQERDSRQPDTWSEEWRLECEARFALSLPDVPDRRKKGWQAVSKRQYLAGVREKRGQQGHDVLRAEMLRLWKMKK